MSTVALVSEPFRKDSQRGDSKYDHIKVKVWLDASNHYVLSRFLVSRRLTATKVPADDAVKVSLDLKRSLVDSGSLEVMQSELENHLFALLSARGFGKTYLDRYRKIDEFHRHRIPLVVILFRDPMMPPGTLATDLASRLNLPHVVQMDLLVDTLRAAGMLGCPACSPAVASHAREPAANTLEEHIREGPAIAQAMTGELEKAIRDGKSVIFEGSCMEPRATMQRVQRLLATFNESPATARGAPAPVFVPCLLVAPPGRFAADPGMCEMLRHLDAQCSEMGMSRVVVDDEDPQGALDALHEQWLDALLRAL